MEEPGAEHPAEHGRLLGAQDHRQGRVRGGVLMQKSRYGQDVRNEGGAQKIIQILTLSVRRGGWVEPRTHN